MIYYIFFITFFCRLILFHHLNNVLKIASSSWNQLNVLIYIFRVRCNKNFLDEICSVSLSLLFIVLILYLLHYDGIIALSMIAYAFQGIVRIRRLMPILAINFLKQPQMSRISCNQCPVVALVHNHYMLLHIYQCLPFIFISFFPNSHFSLYCNTH